MITYCMLVKKSQSQSPARLKKTLALTLCFCSQLALGSEHCEKSNNHWFSSILNKQSSQELRCDSKALLDVKLDSAYQQASQDDVLFRRSLDRASNTYDQTIFDSDVSKYSDVSGGLKKKDIETLQGFKTLD